MRTFVINLARAADRRISITEHLKERGVEFELWSAVDGRKLTDVDHTKFRQEHPTYHYSRASNAGINGWVGCTRSHQTLCQHIADTWNGPTLVLEDDARLNPDWLERTNRALEKYPHTELLLVGSSVDPRALEDQMVRKPRLTHAYLINTVEMAQALATVWLDESTEGDEVWWKVMAKGTTLALQPPAAVQAGGVSYITGMTPMGAYPTSGKIGGIQGLARSLFKE